MPTATITLTTGKSKEYIDQLSASISEAVVDAYLWPSDDLFHRFIQVEPGALIYKRDFKGGTRSEDFMIIELKSDPRQRHQKDDVFESIVKHLSKSPGIRPEDIYIILDSVSNHEDYSFGGGISANKY